MVQNYLLFLLIDPEVNLERRITSRIHALFLIHVERDRFSTQVSHPPGGLGHEIFSYVDINEFCFTF